MKFFQPDQTRSDQTRVSSSLADFHCVGVSGPSQRVHGPRNVIYFLKSMINSQETPGNSFQTSIFQSVFSQAVFFQTVFSQSVFFKTVFVQTVFFQTVFFQTVLSELYFPKLYFSNPY